MAELLILIDGRGRKYAVPLDAPMVQVPDLGTLEGAKLRANVGRRVVVGGRSFLVLPASTRDLLETMRRGPQALVAKDLSAILFEAGVEPGGRVIEAGSGSGALTLALARAVGPKGRVVSYDLRADLQAVARTNVRAAGLEDIVEFREADVRKGIGDREVDAVVLDMPDPWAAIQATWEALRAGGHVATFSPNMEQVKETVAAMKARPFVDVRTIEIIEREIEVRDVGVRPSFAPLGHTGYLTFARKVFETF